jgi:hypothetical protein
MIPSPAERLSISSGASYLGVVDGTFRRWLREGVLANRERIRPQSVVIGGRIFTTEAWLDAFVASVTAAKTKTPVRVDEDRARRADNALAASGW